MIQVLVEGTQNENKKDCWFYFHHTVVACRGYKDYISEIIIEGHTDTKGQYIAAGFRPCAKCMPKEYKLWKDKQGK